MSMVENYSRSIEVKKKQLTALEASVRSATDLFQANRVEYIEVLFARRDLLDRKNGFDHHQKNSNCLPS